MYSEEIDDNLQIIPIRDKLSKMLGEILPEVHDELAATFEDEFRFDGDGEFFVLTLLGPVCSPSHQSGGRLSLFPLSLT